MNVYSNLFNLISTYELEHDDYPEAKEYFQKTIKFNSENLELKQPELDLLIEKYKNKSLSINKSLLAANSELLKDNPNSKEVYLFLTDKSFKLDGLTELFFQSYNKGINSLI